MTAYATVAEANAYFDTRLHSELWNTQTVQTKTKALADATRRIDRLNFSGEKAAANAVRVGITGESTILADLLSEEDQRQIYAAGLTQELEFPRGTDSEIPGDIKIACYEIAFALIDGVDPEGELEDLSVISQGYSSVRTTYDRSFSPEHILAGIPSAVAWRYLKPFLRSSRGVNFRRV